MRLKNLSGLFTGVVLGACVFALAIRHFDNQERSRKEQLKRGGSAAVVAADELQPILCPPAGSPTLQNTAPDVGHHHVMLDWKASVPSKDPKAEIVGYCLYRSKKKGAARKNPRCADCEQINTVPIPGTRCRDDLVEDDKTYFYIAVAIAKNRQMSVASNEAQAGIPKKKNSVETAAAAAYPPCRSTDSNEPGSASGPKN
jgi:hypothetical protein